MLICPFKPTKVFVYGHLRIFLAAGQAAVQILLVECTYTPAVWLSDRILPSRWSLHLRILFDVNTRFLSFKNV